MIQADTVEELAEKMGVDAATLKETFERTTRDAASGVDTLFEKEFLYPLDTPPFYAIHEGSTLLSTCSGLHTDEVAPSCHARGRCHSRSLRDWRMRRWSVGWRYVHPSCLWR